MMVSVKKYSLIFFGIFLISACRQNFEWVNINPDKLILASKRAPAPKGVRNVSITLDLKEKQKEIYYNSTEDFISQQPSEISVIPNEKMDNNDKNTSSVKTSLEKKTEDSKNVNQQVLKTSRVKPALAVKEVPDFAAEKLNGALKIPEDEKAAVNKEDAPDQKLDTSKDDENKSEMKLQSKKLTQTDNNEVVKIASSTTKTTFTQFLNSKKGNSFLLAGLVMVIMGVVLGVIFGRTAFLISAAGLVFAVIGIILKL